MSATSKSLCWAAAILFLAAGIRFGFMGRDAGITVLLILPILAVMTSRRPCFGTGEAA